MLADTQKLLHTDQGMKILEFQERTKSGSKIHATEGDVLF